MLQRESIQGKSKAKWREANRRRELQTSINPCHAKPPLFLMGFSLGKGGLGGVVTCCYLV